MKNLILIAVLVISFTSCTSRTAELRSQDIIVDQTLRGEMLTTRVMYQGTAVFLKTDRVVNDSVMSVRYQEAQSKALKIQELKKELTVKS